MNFFSLSFPMGRFAGIAVRVHFTFLIYVYYWMSGSEGHYFFAAAVLAGLYFSILLHEFGHALAARFCDGDAEEIILWPFGGLAFCRTVFNPTAQLITTVAGPFVTLVLFILFSLAAFLLAVLGMDGTVFGAFVVQMAWLNGILLVFNLLPAFPMDGGRILLELLWYWLNFERAALIAIIVSRVLAVTGMVVGFSGLWGGQWLGVLALMIFFSSSQQAVAMAASAVVQPFSLRERLKRWKRKRDFFGRLDENQKKDSSETFHLCAVCKRTELDAPDLVFRVAADGNEYCRDHLPSRR